MRILGIGPDIWISSAALIEDGRVVAAAPEERFNRQKMSSAFPSQAIEYCLRQARCSLDSIDCIAVAWNPGDHIKSASRRYTNDNRWRGEFLVSTPAALLNHMGNPNVWGMEEIIHSAGKDTRVVFVSHHMAHAANAFFLSPFKDAAVFTADGHGEAETCTFCLGHDNKIETLETISLPHSLGLFYGAFTQYLGFKPDSDEWKVMALASYGTKGTNSYYPLVRSLMNLIPDGTLELDLTYFSYYLFDNKPTMFTDKLVRLLGQPRHRNDPISQRHYDIAGAVQSVFEETSTHMLRHLHSITGQSNLALAGGCVMNSVYNGKILECAPFDQIFISSCPDDSGASVGAALYLNHCTMGNEARHPQEDNYWGPEYSTQEIEDTLLKFKVPFQRCEDITSVAAELLTDGKLIGWFQGRMEFGQRALGNRSILADPRDASIKDQVNAAVKYRESFRPFAPSILEEHTHEWFEAPPNMTVPYMEKVYPVKEHKRGQIPAVVHVDGTGRLQTVSRLTNPRFYELIQRFYEATGVPVVLNTSFNLNGEPIVESPTDAIRTFYSCGLDALILDTFLVKK